MRSATLDPSLPTLRQTLFLYVGLQSLDGNADASERRGCLLRLRLRLVLLPPLVLLFTRVIPSGEASRVRWIKTNAAAVHSLNVPSM